MNFLKKYHLRLFLLVLFNLSFIWSKDYPIQRNSPAKVNYSKDLSILQAGNVLQQISNDGLFPFNGNGIWKINKNIMYPKVKEYNSNYYWQSGVIFQEGILWGGKVNDGQTPVLRVNGTTYYTGMVPGGILGIRTGNVENPDNANVKIWHVRRDWKTADLSEESYFLSKSEDEIRNMYQSDWANWPADNGAPFEDVDGDGQYNPDVDIPGVPGADQTIWYVANDINGDRIYGSPAIGIEMQKTLWTYNRPVGNPFADMIFKRVRLLYKGTSLTPYNAMIDSMFITQWVDPDIGNSDNDLVGCDTTLQLAFAYNGKSTDSEFEPFSMAPPVISYMLLAGPNVPSVGDTAIINFKKRLNQKNLSLSGFYWFAANYSEATDPDLYVYQGTNEWFNLMRGFMPQPGYPSSRPWIDPTNGQETKFPIYGDPIQKTGWYDGKYLAPGDRRMGLSVGPFQMAIGDTQEVVFAFIGEQWMGRQAYLHAISNVKSKAKTIKNFLQKGFSVGIVADRKQIPINVEAIFRSDIIFLDKTRINTYEWKIIKQPVNGNAYIDNAQDSVVTFTANAEGFYTIQVKAVTSDGQIATGEITVYAFDDQPPKAIINLDKYEITWGDSILADASNSYDPDGDSLSFYWELKPPWWYGGDSLSDSKKMKTKIFPFSAGNFSLQLNTYDGVLSDTAKTKFLVHPYLKDISIKYTLTDSSWYRAIPYYYQNYILIPMYKKGFMRIYQATDNGIAYFKDVSLSNSTISSIRTIKDNYIFFTVTDTTTGFYNYGFLSIYRFDANWNLTPVLSEYSPDGKPIQFKGFVGDSALVITNSLRDYYWIDFFTEPQTPKILVHFQAPSGYGLRTMNDKYLFFLRNGNTDSLFVYDIFTFSHIKNVDWMKRFYFWDANKRGDFSITENYLFAENNDSLSVYSIKENLDLEHLCCIQFTPPFHNAIVKHFEPTPHIYRAYLIKSDLLCVMRYGYNILFDFTYPRYPKEIAYFGDGYYFDGIVESNGNFWSRRSDLLSHNEIVKFSIPYFTGINNRDQNLPKKFNLGYNYPNPFNPETKIFYELPVLSNVELTIYNTLGQKICTLVHSRQLPGKYEIKWDGKNEHGIFLPSGVYLYRLKAGKFVQTKKMILLR